MKKKHTNN